MRRGVLIFFMALLPVLAFAAQQDSLVVNKEVSLDKKLALEEPSAEHEVAPAEEQTKKSTKQSAKQKKASKSKPVVDLPLDTLVLDTIHVKAQPKLNDYTLIGVYAGAGGGLGNFNPRPKNDIAFMPLYVGFQYTRMGKMFGYLPYFGFQAGAEVAQEGYKMRMIDDRYVYRIFGYSQAKMTLVHAYYQGLIHFDFWKMRAMVHVGAYAGARLNIHRSAVEGDVTPSRVIVHETDTLFTADFKDSFTKYDNKFDYGVKAGAGFAVILDPIEIHVNATFKHSLNPLYKPNYNSDYYYQYAYPMSFYVSIGVHYQLTRRVGKTKKVLKREAWDIYKTEQNILNGN